MKQYKHLNKMLVLYHLGTFLFVSAPVEAQERKPLLENALKFSIKQQANKSPGPVIKKTRNRPYQNKTVVPYLGLGYALASVEPNTDGKFYEGGGLGINFGVSSERALSEFFALTARIDIFSSIDLAITASNTSLGGMATVGFVIGKSQQAKQFFFSANTGVGVVFLGDLGLDQNGKRDCLFCSPKEGGASAGLATRLAIGRTNNTGQRLELVYMRTGGNGNNLQYANGEEAFLQTVTLQFSGSFIRSPN